MILNIALITLATYIIGICIYSKKIPESISETYYLGGGIMFTITMLIVSLLTMIGLLDLSEGSNWQFLSFITSAGILFVGAAPQFKEDFISKVHYGGALSLMVGSQLWVVFLSNPYILLIWVTALIWGWLKQWLLFLELTCIISLYLGTILK